MLTQNEIKLINALKTTRGRKKAGLFLVEGIKMVEELLHYPEYNIQFIAATASWIANNKTKLTSSVKEISERELQKLSNFSSANEVIAVVDLPFETEFSPKENTLYLVLDGLQDPGNLGTILRTADWFGIHEVICSPDTVDCFNPKVVQATMGSVFRVKCNYTQLYPILSNAKIPVYGTLLKGENIYQQSLQNAAYIVIGNESKGISEPIKHCISNPLYIPSLSDSDIESLNASVATAIVCSEFRRTEN
ncbi:MAG: RNA methyltransferase [Bacteroidales bacterium]|nr:RNA methyltransferase [Bacteroidales bacterium]